MKKIVYSFFGLLHFIHLNAQVNFKRSGYQSWGLELVDTVTVNIGDSNSSFLKFGYVKKERPDYYLTSCGFNPFKINPPLSYFTNKSLLFSDIICGVEQKNELLDSFRNLSEFFFIRRFSPEDSSLLVLIPMNIDQIKVEDYKFITLRYTDMSLIRDSLISNGKKLLLLRTLMLDSTLNSSPYFTDYFTYFTLQTFDFFEFDSAETAYYLRCRGYNGWNRDRELNSSPGAFVDNNGVLINSDAYGSSIRMRKRFWARRNRIKVITIPDTKVFDPPFTKVKISCQKYPVENITDIVVKIIPFEKYKDENILCKNDNHINNLYSLKETYDPDIMIAKKDINIAKSIYMFLQNPHEGKPLISCATAPIYPCQITKKNGKSFVESISFNIKGRCVKSLIVVELESEGANYIGISLIYSNSTNGDFFVPEIIWYRL
jgi:hypothetical protein